MNWQALDPSILGPALAAGLIVLCTHVPLGRRVLQRGIIFIDLAVAQIAGLGVIAAHSLGDVTQGWAVQAAAFGAAVTGALLLYAAERRWPQVQEAVIGSTFVLAATGAILLLANDPHGGEQLQELLAGQILWVGFADLWPAALLSALVLAAWYGFGARRSGLAFYGLFAVAVTASVQLVGVYLVFASLIIPALGSRRYGERSGLAVAFAIGVCGYAIGLALSALFDLPAGPLIVWSLSIAAGSAVLLRYLVGRGT